MLMWKIMKDGKLGETEQGSNRSRRYSKELARIQIIIIKKDL